MKTTSLNVADDNVKNVIKILKDNGYVVLGTGVRRILPSYYDYISASEDCYINMQFVEVEGEFSQTHFSKLFKKYGFGRLIREA